MIKKPTLIVLLVAIIAGAAVYYFDWKRGQKEAESATADPSKPAFSVQPEDISSLTISYPADPKSQPVQMEKRNGSWQITQPIQTGADDASVQGIVEQLATARVNQTEPGAPDRLKVYGLDTPDVSLDFQLKNGAKHNLKLGKKDFTGASVYALVDNNTKDVPLLPESLLVSSDKPLQALRDNAVLHFVNTDIHSFELKNSSGDLIAAKEKDGWKFSKPAEARGDEDAITSLLSSVSAAKMTAIASETPGNLAKYGLANPSITFTASDEKGKSVTLLVGKKEDDEYFARDPEGQMIFRVNQEVYKKLAQNYSDLRDRKIVHLDQPSITHVEIHNASGTIVCARKSESEWTFDEPPDQKGKSASPEKLFSALALARAEEVLDHPAPGVITKLSRPAFEAILRGKDGTKLTIEISKESGAFVYARSSDNPTIYKLKAQILTDLNVKAADLAF
jgi:hypothetical protein